MTQDERRIVPTAPPVAVALITEPVEGEDVPPFPETYDLTERRMSYEAFLKWADEDTLAEWVDGKVIIHTPASGIHQDLTLFLGALLDTYVRTHRLGIIRLAPFQMRLARSGREPDLIFVAQEHLERLKETHLDGPADMVVEIVSPESRHRDRVEKFYEYQANGVREYWVIDPHKERAEFYRLDERGRYEEVFTGREGKFRSEVVEGFWLLAEWLWRRPLPSLEKIGWLIEGYDTASRRLIETVGDEEVLRSLLRLRGRERVLQLLGE